MSRKEKIQNYALARKISFLVHFTKVENIPSILQHGLISVSTAQQRGICPSINDEMRLDGRQEGTSLSISFPNGPMFYKLRNSNPAQRWAILAVQNSVLWSKDVLFCSHNAADGRVSSASDEELRKAASFEALFEEKDGIDSRQTQCLRDYDPTDVQAEVLVMEPIEPEFIIGALFNDKNTLDEYSKYFGRRKLIVHSGVKGLFAKRDYYRKFGGS